MKYKRGNDTLFVSKHIPRIKYNAMDLPAQPFTCEVVQQKKRATFRDRFCTPGTSPVALAILLFN
jgi:hypothetical protein